VGEQIAMRTVCNGLERSSNDLVINGLQEWICSGIAWWHFPAYGFAADQA